MTKIWRSWPPSGVRLADEMRMSALVATNDLLDHEGGRRYYFRHLSPKAKTRKRTRRRMARASRRANR